MEPLGAVLEHVYALGDPRDAGDADLLSRFRGGDAAAFAALVRRHGPLVFGVCRRLLGDTPDADDAFQATFLLLVRKAGTLRRPEALGPWLFGVARRTALKARSLAAKRARRETPLADAAAPDTDPDLGPALDAAVAALPAKSRAAVVLCYLEGLPQAEAAQRLGCPPNTVATRLARARERLRRWLGRRGYGPAAFAPPEAVPAALLARAAALTPGAAVPSSVAILAEGVGRAMLMQTWSKTLACVAMLGLAGVGAWTLGPVSAQPPAKAPTSPQPVTGRDEATSSPAVVPPFPADKEVTFEFRDKRWGEILEWLVDQTGWPLVGNTKATGTFTYIAPKGANGQPVKYKLARVVDLINEGLAQQKYMLVRKEAWFIVVPTDEPPAKPTALPVATVAIASRDKVAVRCRLTACEPDSAGGLKSVEKVVWCPYPLAQVVATEAGGRRLSAAELTQRLARETPVFVAADGAPVDASLLKMPRPDTLVLQLPPAAAPQPAAP